MFADFTGGSSLAVEAIAEPLLLALMIMTGRLLKRRAGVQLGVLYQLFSVAFSFWLPLEVTRAHFLHRAGILPQEGEVPLALLNFLRSASIVLSVFFILALVRRYYWEIWFVRHRREKAPKFLSQLFGLLLFVAAIVVVIGGVYGKSIEGAVFGSTVVVGIIGFAMQDLLGNVIAGIALEFGKPFKTGDWLAIDGLHAEVIEVNWRSTRLRTTDDIHLDIPNKTIAGSKITNFSYPTRQHALRITVGFDYNVPPNFAKDVLARAAGEAKGVLAMPPPHVFLKDFGESSIIYEIKFWLEDEAMLVNILDAIRTNIWYAAQRDGIRMPFPIRTVQIERPASQQKQSLTAARSSVRKQPFLKLLADEQIDQLLHHARLLRFGRGEKIIQQGAAGESMFILLSGECDVFVSASGQSALVATLRTGDCCGEMSLLTGEPRSATVIARVDCEMWEIDKHVFAEVLQENEPLVQQLGELLARRRIETEGILASTSEQSQIATKQKEYTEGFLRKLYSFFEL
jgi:small-conductance mechanosensitive channel/CRP-like cAMP-binding protein